jgi:hypothetical protein
MLQYYLKEILAEVIDKKLIVNQPEYVFVSDTI